MSIPTTQDQQTTIDPTMPLRNGISLEACNGMLYVVCHEFDYNEPQLCRWWWPTGIEAGQAVRSYGQPFIGVWGPGYGYGKLFTIGGDDRYADTVRAWLDKEQGGRYVLCRTRGSGNHISRLLINLTNGGSTTALYMDFLPVSRPPARGKELRWYRGGWQRLLRQGWVSA